MAKIISHLPFSALDLAIPADRLGGHLGSVICLSPVERQTLLSKGALLSLFPTLVQLLVVFPMKAHKGQFGLDLGLLTPAFVVLFNLVWGVVTALTVKTAT